MKKWTNIIIDTDPGIDDAAAITAALHLEELNIKLITTVGGNVSVDKTTNNALKLLGFFEKNIPVAKGVSKPILRPLEDASHVHGETGMGGYEFDEPKQQVLPIHAVEAMREMIMNSEEPITLVPIGPLSNIALLLTLYPECKNNIERIVLMGGSAVRGNHTPNAEYNIYADPEAAKIVFESEIKIVMVGLDVTNVATLSKENLETINSLNQTGHMLYSLFQTYRGGSIEHGRLAMHDVCAIAYLVKPELFKTQECFVDIETAGTYTSGTTVVDLNNRLGKPANVEVCLEVDVEQFRTWFIELLKQMK